jgi:hypothetical protein
VAKISGVNGACLWLHAWDTDGNSNAITGLAVDSAGDVIAVGRMNGAIDFGGGTLTPSATDVFAVKLNGEDGVHLVSKRFGSTSSEIQIAVDTFGTDIGLTLVAAANSSIDFGSGALPCLSPDYCLAVARMNSTLTTPVWAHVHKTGADPNLQRPVDMKFASDGSAVVACSWEGDPLVIGGGPCEAPSYPGSITDTHGMLLQLDTGGNVVGAETYESATGNLRIRGLEIDPMGAIYSLWETATVTTITTSFGGTTATGTSFLVKHE